MSFCEPDSVHIGTHARVPKPHAIRDKGHTMPHATQDAVDTMITTTIAYATTVVTLSPFDPYSKKIA